MGLDYTCRRLNTKGVVSPRIQLTLISYQDCIEQALGEKEVEKKRECLIELRAYEKLIGSKNLFLGKLPDEAQALQDKILELRELQYFARYGDYLAGHVSKLRHFSSEAKTSGHSYLSGKAKWTDIAQSLAREEASRASWEKVPAAERDLKNQPYYPVFVAVFAACQFLGFDLDAMLWAIKQYAARDCSMHADIQEVIDQGKWIELDAVVHQDLQELPLIIPADCPEDERQMAAILEGILDTYLDRSYGHADRPWTWGPSNFAKEESRQIFQSTAEKEGQRKELEKKRERAAVQVKEMAERQLQASTVSCLHIQSENEHGKRVASIEVPYGSDRDLSVDQMRRKRRVLN